MRPRFFPRPAFSVDNTSSFVKIGTGGVSRSATDGMPHVKKQVLPFLPLIATIGGVVAALAAGNHPPAGAPDNIVVLGEVDLAERAVRSEE